MNKIVSSKITALIFGVLTIVFLAVFYVIAWQEPAQVPPGGNVPTPINVGTEPQAKAGRFSATEFYDYNDPSYYLNPSGSSVIDTLCLGGECFNRWPAWEECKGVCGPSNTISCGTGWTEVVSHSGTGCEGYANLGVRPRLGGRWEFAGGYDEDSCTDLERVLFGGRQETSVQCRTLRSGTGTGCDPLNLVEFPSFCAICCK